MVVALAAVSALASKEPAAQTAKPPLTLETKIPLGGVAGRIDHMAIDLARNRLFVAELGNNSVGVVDLTSRKVVHRIAGLKEPQGVAYAQATDTLYVATRGDGSLRIFRGQNYTPVARVELDSDADNVRIDASAGQVIVGYGNGALAVIDMANHRKIGSMPLKGHPESFQLDPSTSDVFINLPDVRALVVLDRVTGQVRNGWTVPYGGNFAMALDNEAQRVLSVFRDPAKLVAFSKKTGSVMEQVNTCSDVDDVFLDAARKRIYTSCGEGFIDVRDASVTGYPRLDRLVTAPGARTSLFVPDTSRLFLAVRGQAEEPAAIWVYKAPE
jgi:YVTN family beta-propeller protein